MAINKSQVKSSYAEPVRYALIGALVVAAFFGAYKFALASNTRGASAQTAGAVASAAAASGAQVSVSQNGVASQNAAGGGAASGGAGSGCACCGGGGSNDPVAGKTTLSGGAQKVTIDLTTGSYSPNKITAKAGVPLELDFKGPASGCNGQVVSQDLGFQQDVSNGGTIRVAALQPGTYSFSCSMNMYTAQIIVK